MTGFLSQIAYTALFIFMLIAWSAILIGKTLLLLCSENNKTVLLSEWILQKLPVMTEKCVLKEVFVDGIFFHFWLTEIKQVNLVQFLWVWSGFLKKKENERTLIKYLKTFQAQFLHSVKTYLIVKPVQGQVFAGKLTIFDV